MLLFIRIWPSPLSQNKSRQTDGVPEYLLPGVEVLKSLPASVAGLQNQENNFLRALVVTLATLIQ
jgi:hypothetical protein